MLSSRPNQFLLSAIAKYWHSLSSISEDEMSVIREWPQDAIERGIIERSIALCDIYVQSDSNQKIIETRISKLNGVLYLEEQREWYGINLNILGLKNNETSLPGDFKETILGVVKTSLTLCILPSPFISDWQEFVSKLRKEGYIVVPLYPSDINALALGYASLFDLIEFKIYRIELLNKLDIETQFSEFLYREFTNIRSGEGTDFFYTMDAVLHTIDDTPDSWAVHPFVKEVETLVSTKKDCILVGQSSCGKTILSYQVGLRLVSKGVKPLFTDLGVISPKVSAHVFRTLLEINARDVETVLIIDDLQSNPSVARMIFSIRRLIRNAAISGKLSLLAITWPSYESEATSELPDAYRLHLNYKEIQHSLLIKYGEKKTAADVAAIAEIADEDVLVWRLLLESKTAEPPSRTQLAKVMWEKKIKNFPGDISKAKRSVLIAAILGRFEFDISRGFLSYQADVDDLTVEHLLQSKVLRKSNDKLVLGHRSMCSILSEWLLSDQQTLNQLRNVGRPTNPIDIVDSYIKLSETRETWAILKSLYAQVGFKGGPSLGLKAQVLADAWESIDSLMERIEQQQVVDHTWGYVFSSALFAVEALCAVGKNDKARTSIEFMRSLWKVDNNRIELEKGSKDRGDFDLIREKMKEEEKFTSSKIRNYEYSNEFDPGKAHYNWTLGLILCAEYAYGELSKQDLLTLALYVEKEQEISGSFYPHRIPWVTARVLMGLARCGRSYDNSEVVKKVCNWLLLPIEDGGVYQNGIWESGTGVWNSTLEVTAMCIIALIEAGIPSTDPRLVDAWNYIASLKNEWTRPKHEIDGANALIAYLKIVGNWQSVIPEVQYLLKWARSEAFWNFAMLSSEEMLDQSCKVAVIADYLIEAAWSSLRSDLPEFLRAFAVPSITSSSISAEKDSRTIGESFQPSIVDELSKLRKILKDLEAYNARLRGEEKLNSSDMKQRHANIDSKIKLVNSERDSYLESIKKAKSENEINDIINSWQDIIQNFEEIS